jgi:UDP:flavonoid glycosyltransferase YjiC (YdhE family)
MFDQEINMRRVVTLGLGIKMSSRGYDGEALGKAVRAVLSDTRYRERCRQVAARISRLDGPRCAALHIHHFLEHKNPDEHPISDTCAAATR